jgi:protein-disulfide isomerase
MGFRQQTDIVVTVVMGLCAVVLTALVVRREVFRPGPPKIELPRRYDDWAKDTSNGKAFGPNNAPITILEFSDFECPFCRRFALVIDTLRDKHKGAVRVIFRNYPLVRIHPFARLAAFGAECANDQKLFEQFHDYVFAHQDALSDSMLGSVPREIGADTALFSACVLKPTTAAKLAIDSIAGAKLHLLGTPLVFVNGWRFNGAPTVADVEKVIGAGSKQ